MFVFNQILLSAKTEIIYALKVKINPCSKYFNFK